MIICLFQFQNKLSKSKTLMSLLLNDMTSTVRAFTPNSSLIQDILPILMYIIQPSLRPVSYIYDFIAMHKIKNK